MTEPHDHAAPGDVDWDAFYASTDRVWSGDPNGALVAEAADLPPGTALDVGCGEGADVIWLARRGWRTTGLDVAATALARAAQHVADAGLQVTLLHTDLFGPALTGAQFDLVSAQYPVLPHEQGRSLAALLDRVAPGGTLLFVHHVLSGADLAQRQGLDPADFLMPGDVRAGLDDAWEVQVFEERPRHVVTGAGAGHAVDLVLRARRRSG